MIAKPNKKKSNIAVLDPMKNSECQTLHLHGQQIGFGWVRCWEREIQTLYPETSCRIDDVPYVNCWYVRTVPLVEGVTAKKNSGIIYFFGSTRPADRRSMLARTEQRHGFVFPHKETRGSHTLSTTLIFHKVELENAKNATENRKESRWQRKRELKTRMTKSLIKRHTNKEWRTVWSQL